MTGYHGPRKGIVQGAFHHHLLTDAARVDAYARAIRAVVRPGDVVADLGAGSGVLAGVAARAGARRVFAVESDPNTHRFLERFVTANGLTDIVEPVHADAEEWVPPEPVDVLACEMIETGLMNEDQVPVMNHVHRAWPRAPRALVPYAVTCTVSLVHAEEAHHGFRVLLPHFERGPGEPALTRLTDPVPYLRVDLTSRGPLRVSTTVDARTSASGPVNAVLLETMAHLADGIDAGGSPDHASPLVLPLDEPVDAGKGDRFDVHLAYVLGSVTGQVDVTLSPAP